MEPKHLHPAHERRLSQGGGYGAPPPGGGFSPPGQPGGYGPPGYGPPGYGPPGYGPPGSPYGSGDPEAALLKKQAQTWLVVGAVSALTCTCCFGIIGAIFANMAVQAVARGNLADAKTKLLWGQVITIVGIAVGVVMTVISLFHLAEMAEAMRGLILP